MKRLWNRLGAGIFALLLLVGTIFAPVGTVNADAAQDKTKPMVILYAGETNYTNKNVNINVYATDKSGIKSILIKKGKITKGAMRYWKNASNITKAKKKKVPANATYSVRVMDKAGNVTVKRITLTNIDKTKPGIVLKQSTVSGGTQVNVKTSDLSGIKSIKYVKGYIGDASSSAFRNAANITSAKKFTAKTNGYYTVQVIDKAGNKAVAQIYVTVKTALYDMDEYYGYTPDKYTTATDSLNRNYSNALKLRATRNGYDYDYFLEGKYKYFEGDIACWDSNTYDGTMQIYADNELIYTSDKIQPTNEKIHFKVQVGNARFIKIKMNRDDDDYYNYYYDDYHFLLGNAYLYN